MRLGDVHPPGGASSLLEAPHAKTWIAWYYALHILVVTDKCTRYTMALALKGPGDMEHCFKQAIAFWRSQRRTTRIMA